MKEFNIDRWQTGADMPGKTLVAVSVFDSVGDIRRATQYDFTLDQQYASITPEFHAAVEGKLLAAGLL